MHVILYYLDNILNASLYCLCISALMRNSRFSHATIAWSWLFKGTAIGKCPKDKLFRGYIELELQLREFDRCRKLYEKFLEFSPENCTTWIKVSLDVSSVFMRR